MMRLADSLNLSSPGFDTFDPSAIVDDTLELDPEANGHGAFRAVFAPVAAGTYTLVFKCAAPFKGLPGGSTDGDGWTSIDFDAGTGVEGVNIVAVKKAGSTAGTWLVFA